MFPKYLNPIEVLSVYEFVLGVLVAVIFWPVAFILFCINTTLRFICQKRCDYHYPGRFKVADGEDSVFGVKLEGSSKSYIYGYKIISGKPDINVIRSRVEQLFTRTRGYDRLKHAMVHKFGYFCWDTQVSFDATKNVRLLDDFNSDEIVDETRLIDICSSMVGTVCEDDRPQWEILMIPKYRMADEEVTSSRETKHYAIIIRLHHAYCDGISFVLLTNNFLADSPGELPINPMKGFENPVWIKAYIWAKIFIVGPMNFFKNLLVMMITPSRFRVERYVNSKILGKSRPVKMDTLRKIRVASGTSVTSITLAAVYAAVYKTHLRLFPGKPVSKTLQTGSIGVMLPYSKEKLLSNQFTMCRYVGPLEVEDPKERLLNAHVTVRKNASQPDPVFNYYMQRALGSLPKILHQILFSLSGTPIMLSNVPGYKTPVRLFGGEVVDVAAWIPLITTTGIGISSQSYCGKVHFSAISDPQLFPTREECNRFLNEIVNEINIIAKEYGIIEDCNEKGCLKSPHTSPPRKDINDNEESEVTPRPSSLQMSPMPLSTSNKGLKCTLRKDHNANIIVSGKEPLSSSSHCTPVRTTEKVI